MDDAELNRALMRGHVFDDPRDARQAEDRARELARNFNTGPVRWGWWWPLGVGLILTLTGVLQGRSVGGIVVLAVGGAALNAVAHVGIRRLLANLEAAHVGNRRVVQASAEKADHRVPDEGARQSEAGVELTDWRSDPGTLHLRVIAFSVAFGGLGSLLAWLVGGTWGEVLVVGAGLTALMYIILRRHNM